MSRQREIEFANFICKFGEDKVLLDLAAEIVIPAFLAKGLIRKYGDAEYFFYQTRIMRFHQSLCIVGRFMKNTFLEREQIYDNKKGLVPDHQTISSAPSAIFVLILNNHKLIYLHETAYAPNLSNFRSTAQKFLKIRHVELINYLYKKINEDEEINSIGKVTKKYLVEKYPPPDVEIIPLSSESSLNEFIRQYHILRTVETTLVHTNYEIDMNDFFKKVRGTMENIKANKTILKHSNPKGLSKDEAFEQLKHIAGQGNAHIKLEGRDERGDTFRGNNESFNVRVPAPKIYKRLGTMAAFMYESFVNLISSGAIRISEPSQSAIEKIKLLIEKLQGLGPRS